MVIVSTTGFYISVLGPYLANSWNNDAAILKHIMNHNIEEIKTWVKPNDIFVVDRGFRDSLDLLKDLGIHAEMPAFMKRGEKQMTAEMANTSRLVTKVRWVIEAANARIKRWKYLDKVLPNSQIPHIGDYIRIVCAVSNKYLQPIDATKNVEEDELIAKRMLDRFKNVNALKTYVEENNLERRSAKWKDVDDWQLNDFPKLTDEMLRILTLRTYQLKLSSCYAHEYVEGENSFQLFLEHDGLLRIKLQSRHITSKAYLVWISYDTEGVKAWYCKCRAGARTIGTCSHIAAVLWYLGQAAYTNATFGVVNWGQYLDDAAIIPESVDSSDSEESVVEE